MDIESLPFICNFCIFWHNKDMKSCRKVLSARSGPLLRSWGKGGGVVGDISLKYVDYCQLGDKLLDSSLVLVLQGSGLGTRL